MLSLKTDLPEDRIQVSGTKKYSYLILANRHNYIMINFIIRENKNIFNLVFIHLLFVALKFFSWVTDFFTSIVSSILSFWATENYLSSSVATKKKSRWSVKMVFWHVGIVMAKHDLRQLKIDIKDTFIIVSITINS